MSLREQLLPQMMEAAEVAGKLVVSLRSDKVHVGTASFALMFAAARVCRLRGISRDTFVHVSGLMWDLSADANETPQK